MKLLLALITITLAVAGQDTSAPSDERDIGTWRVSKLVFHNESALTNGLTRAQARAELGPALVITKAGLKKLGKEPCAQGRVVETVDLTDLLRTNKITPAPGSVFNLGLPSRVTVFNYGGCIELWLRTDGNMIAGVDSYYFELTKVHPSTKPRP